jgi:hypothetical protein
MKNKIFTNTLITFGGLFFIKKLMKKGGLVPDFFRNPIKSVE